MLLSVQRGLEGTTFIDSTQATSPEIGFRDPSGTFGRNTGPKARASRYSQPQFDRLELQSFGTLSAVKDKVLEIS